MKQLLAFRGLPHDPQGILTAICQRTFVGIELCLNVCIWRRKAGFKLTIAAFADAEGWRRSFYDSQFALLHDCSLAHPAGRA